MSATQPAPASTLYSKSRFGKPPASTTNATAIHRLILLFFAYFAIAFLFHAAGLNIFHILVGSGDGFTAGLPSKIFSARLSPWNPYVQLGQYSFANTQFQPFYPPGLLIMALLPDTFGYNIFILTHFALAGLFFYLFAANRRISTYASFTGGLLFMLGGFLSAHKGHQSMMSTAIWFPLMLLFVDRYVEKRHPRELGWAAVVWSMSFLAGFPQVTLYSLLVVIAYMFYRLYASGSRGWRWLAHGACALSAVAITAFLLSALQLCAVAEVLPYMTREKLNYAVFSENYLPLYHVLAFIMPNLFGGVGITTYSPEHYTVEVYSYMGLLPLALAYAAIRYYRGKNGDVRFWTVVGIVALVCAVGKTTPLNILFFHLPVFNLFRAPTRHLFEVDFAIAMLATVALDLIYRSTSSFDRRLMKSVVRASKLLAVTFVAVYGVSQLLHWSIAWLNALPVRNLDNFPVNSIINLGKARELITANLDPASRTVVVPVIFFCVSFVALLLVARQRWNRILMPVLVLVILADIRTAYTGLYRIADTSAVGQADARPETAFLAAQHFDPDLYRIFTVDPEIYHTYPLLNMPYGWSVVNDYTPMWLKRYVVMTDFRLNGEMPTQNLRHPNVLAASCARYVLARNSGALDALSTAGVVAGGSLVDVVTHPAMTVFDSPSLGPGHYRIQSPRNSQVSLIQAEIPLKKQTLYQIKFTADAPQGLTQPFVVNLYAGPTYDNADQYALYSQLPATATPETALIDSGIAAPPKAFVRFYSQSDTPVDIGDISISEVKGGSALNAKAYRPVYRGADGLTIFLNTKAQPRFRFVEHLRPCRDSLEARAILDGDVTFNVATDALVEGISRPTDLPAGEIVSSKAGDNRLSFRLKTGAGAFFVVGDSWFPGWKAIVDGRETPIMVVDGFLRGVMISSAGLHDLEMVYRPWSVPVGGLGTVAGLLLVLGAWRWGDYLRRSRWMAWAAEPPRPLPAVIDEAALPRSDASQE